MSRSGSVGAIPAGAARRRFRLTSVMMFYGPRDERSSAIGVLFEYWGAGTVHWRTMRALEAFSSAGIAPERTGTVTAAAVDTARRRFPGAMQDMTWRINRQ